MEGKGQKIIALALALLLCAGLSAQNKTEQKDSLVRLIKAKSLELIDKGGAYGASVAKSGQTLNVSK